MVEKKLRLSESMIECLPIIKEGFIKFYGDKYRELIEGKFSNCTFIGCLTIDNIEKILKDFYQKKSKDLIIDFFDTNNINFNNFNKYFFFTDLNYGSKLDEIYEYLDDLSDGNDVYLLMALRDFNGNKDLNFDTKEYINLIEYLKKIRPSYEFMKNEFKKEKSKVRWYEDCVSKFKEESLKLNDKYNKIYLKELEKIKNLNLLDFDFFCKDFEDWYGNKTCMWPNIVFKDDTYSLHCLIMFSYNITLLGYFDNTFIHECNHLIETELIDLDLNIFTIRTGFEIVSNDKSINEKNLKTMNFNEIINELLAQDITKRFHEEGIYFFDDEETARVGGGTYYESCLFLVIEFYNIFKEEIKESRITGDMNVLYNLVGEKNFLMLNDLINEFFNYFGCFAEFNKLYNDLKLGIITDKVRFYNQCIVRKDEILNKMLNYCYKNKKRVLS